MYTIYYLKFLHRSTIYSSNLRKLRLPIMQICFVVKRRRYKGNWWIYWYSPVNSCTIPIGTRLIFSLFSRCHVKNHWIWLRTSILLGKLKTLGITRINTKRCITMSTRYAKKHSYICTEVYGDSWMGRQILGPGSRPWYHDLGHLPDTSLRGSLVWSHESLHETPRTTSKL